MRGLNVLRRFSSATSLFFVVSSALALDTPEVYVADFSATQTVSGISIAFPGQVYLSADFSVMAAPVVAVHATVDLSNLQGQIPALVAKLPLPTNNCASYSPKNPVVLLSNTSLTFSGGGQAAFHTDGSAVIWDCTQSLAPCTKVVWKMKNVLGVKIKIPELDTFSCNPPLKTILGTQPFAIDVPLGLKIDGRNAIQLVPGDAPVTLSGQYASITKVILDQFKINLSAMLTDAIKKSFDTKAATASIPAEFTQAGLSLSSANFVQVKDALGVDVKMKVNVTGATVREMGQLLYSEIKKKL